LSCTREDVRALYDPKLKEHTKKASANVLLQCVACNKMRDEC